MRKPRAKRGGEARNRSHQSKADEGHEADGQPRRQLSRPSRSLVAIMLAIITKASLSTALGAKAAIVEPVATPAIAGSAHLRTTSIITAALSRWVRNDSTLVGTMMAMEVPTQS